MGNKAQALVATFNTVVATSLNVSVASGTYGGTVNLSATLTTTSGGTAVSNKTISFTLNGGSVGTAITNPSGVATLSSVSLSGISAGIYPAGVGAGFAGDASFANSSGAAALNVNKLTVVVTPGAGQHKTYGQSDPTLTYGFAPALIGGDTFSGALARDLGETAGLYNITQGTLALSSNYTLNFTPGAQFEIKTRPITVTADAKTKTYGDPDPMFTFAVGGSGLAAGDTIASVFSGALTRAIGETVAGSPYAITQGTLVANSNYNITSFTPNALTIGPKQLVGSITVYNKEYDGNNSAAIATRTLSGVVNGDDVSYVGGTATFDNKFAGTGKLVTATGLYLSGAQAGNYTVNSTATTYADIGALGFDGFLPPLGGADSTGGDFANPIRTIKLGSTIPVKFVAFTNGGVPWLTGIHTIQAIKYSNATTGDDPLIVTATDAATTGNQFRLTDGQWHFNMSTKSGFSKGIWKIEATLEDGTKHYAWVTLKP